MTAAGSTWVRIAGALSASCFVTGPSAAQEVVPKLETGYWAGVRTNDGALALSRVTFMPSVGVVFSPAWKAQLSLRAEFADDGTGLGSRDAYAPLSEPLVRSPDARVEIDEATLRWRSPAGLQGSTLTIGKQVVAWGSLDGLQVTDRFSPVRLRDFVFFDNRPDRIARWGLRFRTDVLGFDVDLAGALDGTGSQLAEGDAAFGLRAPRFRLGQDPDAGDLRLPPPARSPGHRLDDATFGVRIGRRLGQLETNLVVIDGPDTEPVFTVRDGALAFAYPDRTLYGGSLTFPVGPTLVRVEAATIPDQPFNIASEERATGFAITERGRTIMGAGFDWNAPGGIFVNTQLVVDHVADDRDLFRPGTDVLATFRAQKGLANDTVFLKAEALSALSDGDLVLRPAIEWRLRDGLRLDIGADQVFGAEGDLLGQFEDESRVWIRVRSVL